MPAFAIQSLLTVAQTSTPASPRNIVAHHAYMFHPHGGLEWHWVHVTHSPPDSAAAQSDMVL